MYPPDDLKIFISGKLYDLWKIVNNKTYFFEGIILNQKTNQAIYLDQILFNELCTFIGKKHLRYPSSSFSSFGEVLDQVGEVYFRYLERNNQFLKDCSFCCVASNKKGEEANVCS